MTIKTNFSNLPYLEIRFLYEGEWWIARLGPNYVGAAIKINLDGGDLHKVAAQLTKQLHQQGVDVKTIRSLVFGGPLAILLDRIIALTPKQKGGRK